MQESVLIPVLLGTGVAAFVVYAVFSISAALSVKRAADRLEALIRNTEGNLNGVLEELRGTLGNANRIVGDVRSVTADVRELADTVVGLERGGRDLYRKVQAGVGRTAEANVAGLKAGIRAGVTTLVRNIQTGRGDGHEGGCEE